MYVHTDSSVGNTLANRPNMESQNISPKAFSELVTPSLGGVVSERACCFCRGEGRLCVFSVTAKSMSSTEVLVSCSPTA